MQPAAIERTPTPAALNRTPVARLLDHIAGRILALFCFLFSATKLQARDGRSAL
jgi:hypothetical protein